MLDLQRGQKISIQTVCRTWTLEVELRHQGPLAVDVSCFGLDSAGRLSDERNGPIPGGSGGPAGPYPAALLHCRH